MLVENEAAFIARYGDGILTAGKYSNDLSNGGDHVILRDANDQTIHDFTYSDDPPWPTIADGDGPSLEVVDVSGDYSSSSNWRSSATSNGTPGVQTSSPPGDYNRDSFVDQADYETWRLAVGSTTELAADGSGNNVVDLADYAIWRDHLGSSSQPSVLASSTGEDSVLRSPVTAVLAEPSGSNHAPKTSTAAMPAVASFYSEVIRDGHNLARAPLGKSQIGVARDQAVQNDVLNIAVPFPRESGRTSRSEFRTAKRGQLDPTDSQLALLHELAIDIGFAEHFDEEM